jgi:hypothetical protein
MLGSVYGGRWSGWNAGAVRVGGRMQLACDVRAWCGVVWVCSTCNGSERFCSNSWCCADVVVLLARVGGLPSSTPHHPLHWPSVCARALFSVRTTASLVRHANVCIRCMSRVRASVSCPSHASTHQCNAWVRARIPICIQPHTYSDKLKRSPNHLMH